MAYIRSVNPFNNELLREYEEHTESQLNDILQKSEKTFQQWRKTSFKERSILMKRCGENLLNNKNKLAELISKEMGKPISQAIAEVEKCATACDFYAEYAEEFLKDEIIKSDASKSLISYEPLGSILAVMPW